MQDMNENEMKQVALEKFGSSQQSRELKSTDKKNLSIKKNLSGQSFKIWESVQKILS